MNNIRSRILLGLILLVALVFTIKLFMIQVVNQEYAARADRNIIRKVVEYPIRGLIYDRNNKLMVYNEPEYDLLLTKNEMSGFDSAKFCAAFTFDLPLLRQLFTQMEERPEYSRHKPTLFLGKMSSVDLARVLDQLDLFPGFYVQPRTARAYTTPAAANALGYVSEITGAQLTRDTTRFYKPGDYIGQSGIEAYYEKELRGIPGVRYEMKNVRGIFQGSFRDGAFDTLSVPGTNLYATLDLDLQQYGEKLMKEKVGSIVCIEPTTGEILAFVSSPSYDPNALTGKQYGKNYVRISTDSLKPFFNRPLMAQYRPGSIFKIAQALTALQMGVLQPTTRIRCNRALIGCHGPHTWENLRGAITNSCNPYFYITMRRMVLTGVEDSPYADTKIGLKKWNDYIYSLGFGGLLGIDLPNEKRGLVPTPAYYDRAYNNRPWKYSNIYSISIGEGENLVVPLQMANFAAIVANRGYYYTPHLVKTIEHLERRQPVSVDKHFTKIDTSHFKVAVDAMRAVVESGTGRFRAKFKTVEICGKTGTVQNNPPLKDHSVFIAFAPAEEPEIALSVYVENAGAGSGAAAAIASLLVEKYLLGETSRPYLEAYVLAGKFE